MTLATDDHLRRLPKVELHCHVEGAGPRVDDRRPGAQARRRRSRSRIPPSSSSSASLNQFLSIYDVICASLRTADDFRRITYEALEDGAAAGVRYREMFFSPGFVIRLGVPVETVWEGVKAGVLDARQDLDINCRMILDFDKPTGPAHAMEMAAFAGSVPDRDLLVGMGADSVERDIDHARLRRRVHRGGPATGCAGRSTPARTVRPTTSPSPSVSSGASASTTASVCSTTPTLTAEIVERQIPLDVCPTSNVMIANVVRLGGRPPVRPPARGRRARDAELRRSRDDAVRRRRRVRGGRATRSATRSRTWRTISLAGIDACWAPDDEKQALRRRFAGDFDQLRNEHGLPPR